MHEEWAAALAGWQAVHATEPVLRAAFQVIAIDEAEHAALGRAIGRWLDGLLTDGERTTVTREHARALRVLREGLDGPDIADGELGLPEPRAARALFDSVRWS